MLHYQWSVIVDASSFPGLLPFVVHQLAFSIIHMTRTMLHCQWSVTVDASSFPGLLPFVVHQLVFSIIHITHMMLHCQWSVTVDASSVPGLNPPFVVHQLAFSIIHRSGRVALLFSPLFRIYVVYWAKEQQKKEIRPTSAHSCLHLPVMHSQPLLDPRPSPSLEPRLFIPCDA